MTAILQHCSNNAETFILIDLLMFVNAILKLGCLGNTIWTYLWASSENKITPIKAMKSPVGPGIV